MSSSKCLELIVNWGMQKGHEGTGIFWAENSVNEISIFEYANIDVLKIIEIFWDI